MAGGPETFNPYVGPRAFEESQREFFFGRDEETAILEGLVMARRAALFFAQSGAGKSSLLRAGLIPELTRPQAFGRGPEARAYCKMRVLPVLTVGGAVPAGLPPTLPAATKGASGGRPAEAAPESESQTAGLDQSAANVYVHSALLGLYREAAPEHLAGMTLADAIAPLFDESQPPAAGEPAVSFGATLLIFDQFEELFTHHPERWVEREDFFRQVARALERFPTLHVLFTMREDYIAELVPFAGLLPEQLRPRFRLERLRRQAALDAVSLPARRVGRSYAAGVAEALVDNLSRTPSPIFRGGARGGDPPSPTATGEGRGKGPGEFVEPVHLQIVCRQLWERLPPDRRTIQAEDVQEFGDVDKALRDFYESAVAQTVARTGASERRLRAWFDEHLITPAHTRGLVYRGGTDTEGLPNAVVDILNDAYLIRATMRGGDAWYELAHDRLIDPVLEANRRWAATYYNPLSAPAHAWRQASRDTRFLLRGAQLEDARQFASAHPGDLTEDETAFLAESARQARDTARRRRTATAAVVATMLVLSALAAWALWNAGQARSLAAEARHQRSLAENAAAEAQRQQSLAEQAAAEAQRQQRLAEQAAAEAQRNLEEARRQQSRTLAAQAIQNLATDPQQSIALAIQALNEVRTPEAEDALGRSIQASRLLFSLSGHPKEVNDVAYDPGGTRLATAGSDGVVRTWDAATGKELSSLPDEGTLAWAVAFSPAPSEGGMGRRWLAAGYGDGALKVWDAQTGELVHARNEHTKDVNDVAFSPDGKWLATASSDGLAIVWDAASGEPIRRIAHDSGDRLFAVAFSPDSKLLATAGADATTQIWDLATGANVGYVQGHTDSVTDVAFSPDGKSLATASWDGTAKIWGLAPGSAEDALAVELKQTLTGHSNWVRGVAFSPDGQRLATTSWDRTAKIWDVASGREIFTLYGHKGWLRGLAFSPDGSKLATAGEDKTARVWNIGPSSEFLTVLPHGGKAVAALDFSSCPNPRGSTAQACGTRLATGGRDGTVRVLDAVTGALLVTMRHNGPVRDVAYSPDGSLLASASDDRTAVIWDAATGKRLLVLDRFDVPVVGVAFDSEGKRLATASSDKRVRLWEIRPPAAGGPLSAEEVVALEEQASQVNNVVFSPDGRQVAASGADGMVKLWDAATGKLLSSLPAHVREVYGVGYSPDGKRLLTASVDQTAKVWDVASGQELLSLAGHTDRVQSAAFDAQGTRLATASWDRTARLWDAATGELLRTLTGNSGKVLDVAFTPDGQRLATAGEDGTVRVYLLDFEKLLELAYSRLSEP